MRSFVLAAASLAVCILPAFAEESCQLQRIAVIPFQTDETAHIFIPATLAGRQTRLMLDTGGFWSLIRAELAKDLNLRVKKSQELWLVDGSGAKLDQLATVPEVKLGDLAFSGPVDFFLWTGAFPADIARLGGTLGLNMLTQMDLEIDNAGKTLSLFTQKHCKGAGVYWADEAVTLTFRKDNPDKPIGTNLRQKASKHQIDYPIVGAELEGEPISALFDTGSTVSSMDLGVAKRRFGIGPGSPGVEPAGIAYLPSGEKVDLYSYTFKSLTISGIQFENVPIHLGEFKETQLILGMNDLKYLRLYFAFRDGMIHITAADAGRAQ